MALIERSLQKTFQ